MSNLKLRSLAFVPDLDEQTRAYCRGPVTPKSPNGAREGRFDYFAQGFVDINIPRDSAYTSDIRVATKGFGIADEQGRVVADNIPTYAAMEKAVSGARISVNVAVDLPEEVEATA